MYCKYLLLFVWMFEFRNATSEISRNPRTLPIVKINKCCETNEIYVGNYCEVVGNDTQWRPIFTSERGQTNIQINYTLISGSPDCGHKQRWSIYHYPESTDRLSLLPSGILRHFFDHQVPNEEYDLETGLIDGESRLYHDYKPGKYCMDKKIIDNMTREFAMICMPDHNNDWLSPVNLMHNIVNPITHGITVTCLLIVAIIYFMMPTLRDLSGNIVTTICLCLIVSQIADMIRLLTVFNNHIHLLVTVTVCYISLLGAFFWLNSLGYYIWKTFRSRNVFLRITDGKKYCYYCGYSWSCTIVLGALAVFAHYTMDYPDIKPSSTSSDKQEELGSLAMIIFFVPVAFTILIDVFFFATTLKKINKMHTYGRIHHKLRHSFRMFLLLLMIMTLCWLFFLASFSKYEGLVNAHIVANACQGPVILYICILNQKHVLYMIQKTCCYKSCVCACCQPEPECEWGDELKAMNTGTYSY